MKKKLLWIALNPPCKKNVTAGGKTFNYYYQKFKDSGLFDIHLIALCNDSFRSHLEPSVAQEKLLLRQTDIMSKIKRLSSIVNNDISPTIFPYGPDACELLRQKTPSTFWRQQNSKEIVRTFIFATSKEELTTITAQMRPVQYLVQECLDDNMEWKNDIPENDPFKVVYDKVQNIIKYADKGLPFNFDEKFSVLQKPPYGLYGSFAPMAMMAFA